MDLDMCAGDQKESASPSVSFYASCGFISSSSTVLLMKYFLNCSLFVVRWRFYGRAGGETWSICQQKHGQYVVVRKLTSQSTDPVALFLELMCTLEVWMC